MAPNKDNDSPTEGRPRQLTPLENLKVKELKALLKERGLPVSGRKAKLIKRLRNPPTGPKPKPWQYSDAKKALKKALLDPSSEIHNMSVGEILETDPRFKQYPNFKKYYKDLKEKVEEEMEAVKMDDLLAKMHMMSFPTPQTNVRGYPNWKGHPAKALLEVDVTNKLHKMGPKKLRETRSEYKEFPLRVFTKKVAREDDKQRSTAYWADKRNKAGMKKYLKEVMKRAAEEV